MCVHKEQGCPALTPLSRRLPAYAYAFPTFSGGDEREFLGRFIRADEASLAAVFRAAVGAATRSLFGLGAVRTAAWPTASLSQRLLRAGFCDPLRHHPAAGCAYSREELSAPWFATVSAAGGGGGQRDGSGYRCWWLTACGAMAGVTCWRFCAVRERVRPTGKACSRICIAAGWKASTWR